MYKNIQEIINDKTFKEKVNESTYSKSSIYAIGSALLYYCNFNNKNLSELIKEADDEEEKRVREKNKRITHMLEEFPKQLENKGKAGTTIKLYLTLVKRFYRKYKIEIPYTEPYEVEELQLEYDDIPNVEQIKEAIASTTDTQHKFIIMAQFSSLSGIGEILSITNEMVVEALKEYTNKTDINDVVLELKDRNDIIPFFSLRRIKLRKKYKKGYKYHTCFTPETAKVMFKLYSERIKEKGKLKNEDKLITIRYNAVRAFYNRINTKNGWGNIEDTNINFFHSHAMRIAGNTVVEEEAIGDCFSGRKRTKLHEGYFKKMPWKLKELYIEQIPKLTLFSDVDIQTYKDEATKKIEKQNKLLAESNSRKDDAISLLTSSIANAGLLDDATQDKIIELMGVKK
ncbi:MAG: hypothetical protein ACRCVG_04400 [Methanobacteriaceae archaeon]